MKKLILPLLLILAIGMLAAVESAPSEVVGYVKYACAASGYSMVATPMVQAGLTMASDLGTMINATAVSYWDNTSQSFTGAVYLDFLGIWDGDFALTNGMPLMVNGDAVTVFYSLGDLPATHPSYSVVPGYSMVMVPLNRSDLNLASLVGDDAGATAVSYWDATTQSFTGAVYLDFLGIWDGDFTTAIGDPLMLNADVTGTFPSVTARNSLNTNSRSK